MLFYKIRDLSKDMSLFEADVVDFFPMSVDSAGHTDFEYEANYVKYMIDNNLLEHDKGLIHSHNNMGVFFSGEDMSELQDNTPNHTFYLSLIVNNRFDVMAKMCTIVKMPDSKRVGEYVDIKGDTKKLEIDEPNPEYLFTVDCIIHKPTTSIAFKRDWLDQLAIVIENDRKIKVALPTVGQQGNLFPGRMIPNTPVGQKSGFDDWNSSDYKPVQVTSKDLKEFVIAEVLLGDDTDTLYSAAKDYDYTPGSVKEIISLYDTEFGKTDLPEEIEALKGIANILSAIQNNKQTSMLATEIREAVKFREKQL